MVVEGYLTILTTFKFWSLLTLFVLLCAKLHKDCYQYSGGLLFVTGSQYRQFLANVPEPRTDSKNSINWNQYFGWAKKRIAAIEFTYKWRSQQASFIFIILSATVHIFRPMYFSDGSAKIAAAEIDRGLAAAARLLLERSRAWGKKMRIASSTLCCCFTVYNIQ